MGGRLVRYRGYLASVMSDAISFTKEIDLDSSGHPYWMLSKGTPPIAITNPLAVKRIEPKQTEDDVTAINQALYQAISAIAPKNVRQQLVDLIN